MSKNIDMDGKLELARDTMSGLQYLHNREPPVVHGNITPFNVLINNTGKAMLSDVGWAAIDRHPISTTPRASGRWSSPEVSIGNLATVKSDMWSWACVVLQLVTGDPPYAYIQNEDQVKAVISGRGRVRLTPEAFHELGELPDVFVRLLQRCWDFNSSQRPKADECMGRLDSMLRIKLDGKQTEASVPSPRVWEMRP
ncbi:hypothetical protein FS837_011339 [Tulasnella sp. UAMH 9824]|nr:hypothetical protein FS837_011339 [Tulasnella sp. UAMH 9824]